MEQQEDDAARQGNKKQKQDDTDNAEHRRKNSQFSEQCHDVVQRRPLLPRMGWQGGRLLPGKVGREIIGQIPW